MKVINYKISDGKIKNPLKQSFCLLIVFLIETTSTLYLVRLYILKIGSKMPLMNPPGFAAFPPAQNGFSMTPPTSAAFPPASSGGFGAFPPQQQMMMPGQQIPQQVWPMCLESCCSAPYFY